MSQWCFGKSAQIIIKTESMLGQDSCSDVAQKQRMSTGNPPSLHIL